jgi:hypothetical protein
MLIDIPINSLRDPLLDLMAGGKRPVILRRGVYQIHHHGHSHWPPGFDHSYDVDHRYDTYGVCDNVDQVLEKWPHIEQSTDEFIITLTEIVRAEQPESGGWRWHKWGEYIGKHNPQHEYLFHEKDIDSVFCFHVYKREK